MHTYIYIYFKQQALLKKQVLDTESSVFSLLFIPRDVSKCTIVKKKNYQ